MAEPVEIIDNLSENRYEARAEGDVVGLAAYDLTESEIIFTHTEVSDAMAGQGVGSALARHALDDAHARGLRVVARCPFIHRYLQRHPEYAPR